MKGRGREGKEYAAEHVLLVCDKQPVYNWPRSSCENASEMDLVRFALAKPLCWVGLVWVVDNHLNNAGREMKAAPQAA